MPTPATAYDLWGLTSGRPWIDPTELAAALERQVAQNALDYRTRLLIRDSLDALSQHWGRQTLESWLSQSQAGEVLRAIWRSDLGAPGFPSLVQRIMQTLNPETVRQFLRELGSSLGRETRINVGGSIALILDGKLSRRTEDIDVVDEVPPEVRLEHELLARLASRYGLSVTHFQSHYLPSGWAERLHWVGEFGRLTVFLVDPYDIFVGKLFSAREKDLDDLRELAPQLDKEMIVRRLRDSAKLLRAEKKLAEEAARNWYVVYGEALPSD